MTPQPPIPGTIVSQPPPAVQQERVGTVAAASTPKENG
jgi:hypothetical protein